MKKICLPDHHHNCFVPRHSLGHMMYSFMLLVPMNQKCSTSQAVAGKHIVHIAVFMIIYTYIYIYIYITYTYIYIIYIYRERERERRKL